LDASYSIEKKPTDVCRRRMISFKNTAWCHQSHSNTTRTRLEHSFSPLSVFVSKLGGGASLQQGYEITSTMEHGFKNVFCATVPKHI